MKLLRAADTLFPDDILHVCAFSGGAASAVMSKMVAEAHPGKTVLLYHSTRTEPDDNDRFRREVSGFIGLPITERSDGRDIWQVFKDHRFLGNQHVTPCSEDLKQIMGDRFMATCPPGSIKYLGYTSEEVVRATRASCRAASKGYRCEFPLIRAGIGKVECLARVTKCWGIRLPEMYDWAEHANCVPCVKGGLAYWGMVYLNAPEAWERAARAEEESGGYQILKDSQYGMLREELPHCLELARAYMEKRAGAVLYDVPCECVV
jgi:hypothetical protein